MRFQSFCRTFLEENLLTGSLNWLFTSEMMAFIESSLANMSSGEAAAPPIIDDICI